MPIVMTSIDVNKRAPLGKSCNGRVSIKEGCSEQREIRGVDRPDHVVFSFLRPLTLHRRCSDDFTILNWLATCSDLRKIDMFLP